MNAILKAQNAYRSENQAVRTERGTEYNVLAQITHRMKSASERGSDGFKDLVGALHDNRRLWTILATDVADSKNTLPKSLRARIVYLAEFTRIHTGKVLSRSTNVDALIEINTAVMRGLREGRTVK